MGEIKTIGVLTSGGRCTGDECGYSCDRAYSYRQRPECERYHARFMPAF